jgi:uncharacterized coiled-coil protein SlyX
MFDGDLYVNGWSEWDGSSQIWRVQADGTCEQFCRGKNRTFTFGPDGAMYVLEWLEGLATIQRVYRVAFLSGIISDIEDAIAEKQAAIAEVESSLAKEQAALDGLADMLASGDYEGLTEKDITKAMKKIELSIAEQGRVIGELEDGIARLEIALGFLGAETE